MKLFIQNFWEIYKANEETPESLKTKRQIILTATIPSNIGTIILSVINVFTSTTAVLLSTIFLSVGLLIVNTMVLKNVPIKYVALGFCIVVCPIFSYYVIAGGESGFGINWILLIPLSIFMVFGLKVGLITSTYFLALICICFYSPVKTLLLYEYSEAVIQRFPILYFLSFIFSFIVNFQIKSLRINQIKQNKELVLIANKLENERNHYFDKSTIDELTQLKNRRDFMDTFKRYLSNYRQSDKFLCIAIMDIDYFKKYNDHYGHLAGDECLKNLGNTLKDFQQEMKVYSARVGGEEFALLWFEEKANNAEKNALQLKQKIDDLKIPHEKSEVSSYMTVSIGICIAECGVSNNINELYNKADKALYNAKGNGRNQIVVDK